MTGGSAERSTVSERRAARRYMWEIAAGAVGFMLVFLFLPAIVQAEPGSALSVVIALVPVIPVGWIAVALIRHILRVDEFQRRIVIDSLAIGFGAAMLIALCVAFLSTAAISVSYPEWWVFIGGMATWGIAITVLSVRAGR